jgi:acyl-CoA thioesterase I
MSIENSMESLESRTLLSAFTAHVNFQPPSAPIPEGYIGDGGLLYRQRGAHTYGWSALNRNGVDRNSRKSPDQRYDTFNALSFGRTAPYWEIAVPNGNYQVRIVAGDPTDPKAWYRIRAEGATVIDGKVNKRRLWKENTVTVNVADGRLTITGMKGAIRNKINFIDIIGLTNPNEMMQAEAADLASGTTINGSSVTSLDNGDYLQFKNVLFHSGLQSLYTNIATSPENAGQFIEFHLDSADGPLLGTLKTQATGRSGQFVVQHTDIEAAPDGIRDLYVVFKGGRPTGAIDWLHFDNRPLTWIMPVGDSITEGSGGHASYRHDLWHKLEDAGHAVDFVGTRTGVRSGTGDPPAWDWDMEHEGHFGWRADQARDNILAPMQSQMPDIVLLDVGINDLFLGQSTQSTVDEISQIIDRMRSVNANVTVLVAMLTPTTQVSNATLVDMNNKIAAMAASKSTTQSRIIAVDLYTGFDANSDTYDGTHPTPEAESRQAQRWFDALQTVLPSTGGGHQH